MIPRSLGREKGAKGLTELSVSNPSYNQTALESALCQSSMLGFLNICLRDDERQYGSTASATGSVGPRGRPIQVLILLPTGKFHTRLFQSSAVSKTVITLTMNINSLRKE